MQDQTYQKLVNLEEKLVAAELKILQLEKHVDVLASLVQIQIYELAEYEHPEIDSKYPSFLATLERKRHLLSKIIELFSTETRTDDKSTVQIIKRG